MRPSPRCLRSCPTNDSRHQVKLIYKSRQFHTFSHLALTPPRAHFHTCPRALAYTPIRTYTSRFQAVRLIKKMELTMKRTPSDTATAAVPGDGPKKVFLSTWCSCLLVLFFFACVGVAAHFRRMCSWVGLVPCRMSSPSSVLMVLSVLLTWGSAHALAPSPAFCIPIIAKGQRSKYRKSAEQTQT